MNQENHQEIKLAIQLLRDELEFPIPAIRDFSGMYRNKRLESALDILITVRLRIGEPSTKEIVVQANKATPQ